LVGYNDLATTNPELVPQADGWDPTTVVTFSNKKMNWKCESGHEWAAIVANRAKGHGCPVCSGNQVLVGYNDLATTNPELAAQADGWDPTTLKAFSNKKVGWRCELGHTWVVSIGDRSNGYGCPVCSGRQVLVGYNDLATTNPELAAQADGWDPTTVVAFSNKSMQWKCKLGHVWNTAVYNRSNGYSCPVCSGRVALSGFNDLATTNPELAAKADGWDPTTLTAGSGQKVRWKCHLGHTWKASVVTRGKGHGCPVCTGRQVLAGYNDLATTNPELAAQADGWDPRAVAPNSGKKLRWKCSEGHTWLANVSNRTNGRGCPSCASTGFDPNKKGWLYFIDHDSLQMFQVGISNSPVTRLGQHSKRGWEIIEVRGPMEGHLAQQLETAILHAVERRGAVLGHKAEIEKFDGYSEAWTKDSLSVTNFKQLLDWVYEDDQNIAK
jgi:Zn finger protein HypA/HybF involved in hydrogenase expression